VTLTLTAPAATTPAPARLVAAPHPARRRVPTTRPAHPAHDVVHEWGVQSFPASDPPANW
jgi:hypothetical protein